MLLYAFAGALLGGLDSPAGAVIGGFLVGVIENLGGAYLVGTQLKLTLALAVIAAVLVLKPSGLLGRGGDQPCLTRVRQALVHRPAVARRPVAAAGCWLTATTICSG